MYYTDNPIADYDRYSADQQIEYEKLPFCSECGERITDETCYEVNGELVCQRCMEAFHRVFVDDFTK